MLAKKEKKKKQQSSSESSDDSSSSSDSSEESEASDKEDKKHKKKHKKEQKKKKKEQKHKKKKEKGSVCGVYLFSFGGVINVFIYWLSTSHTDWVSFNDYKDPQCCSATGVIHWSCILTATSSVFRSNDEEEAKETEPQQPVSSIRPEEVPPVPENRFLMRRSPQPQPKEEQGKDKQKENSGKERQRERERDRDRERDRERCVTKI